MNQSINLCLKGGIAFARTDRGVEVAKGCSAKELVKLGQICPKIFQNVQNTFLSLWFSRIFMAVTTIFHIFHEDSTNRLQINSFIQGFKNHQLPRWFIYCWGSPRGVWLNPHCKIWWLSWAHTYPQTKRHIHFGHAQLVMKKRLREAIWDPTPDDRRIKATRFIFQKSSLENRDRNSQLLLGASSHSAEGGRALNISRCLGCKMDLSKRLILYWGYHCDITKYIQHNDASLAKHGDLLPKLNTWSAMRFCELSVRWCTLSTNPNAIGMLYLQWGRWDEDLSALSASLN